MTTDTAEKPASDKTVVKFTKSHGIYVPGDVAGFPHNRADRLIAAGKAKRFDPDRDDMSRLTGDRAEREALAAQGIALDKREAELKAREDALAEREAAAGKSDEAGAPPAAKK